MTPIEAAAALKISRQRMMQLLWTGRIQGAYKTGYFWTIPEPLVKLPGKPMGRQVGWKKVRAEALAPVAEPIAPSPALATEATATDSTEAFMAGVPNEAEGRK